MKNWRPLSLFLVCLLISTSLSFLLFGKYSIIDDIRNWLSERRVDAFEQHILESSRRHGLDHRLVKAVIKAESRCDPTAVSPKGAMGLMQLMPSTVERMGVKDPFDPRENIEAGVRYLKWLLERFNGNIGLALAAYNAGPTRVKRFGRVPPYRETREYVKKVMRFYQDYLSRTSEKA